MKYSNQNEDQTTNRVSRRNSRNNRNSFNADRLSRQHSNENFQKIRQSRTNEEVSTNPNRDIKIEELQKQIYYARHSQTTVTKK